MMKFTKHNLLAALLAVVFISACATPITSLPGFDARPVEPGRFEKKVDHLVFILDASNSMADGYQGHRKLDIARGVVNNFNNTMPDVNVAVALRSFGHADSVSSKSSEILVPTQVYSRAALSSALDRVRDAGGYSPLSRSLKDAAVDLEAVKSPIAMVIVSDGVDMAPGTLAAAQALKAAHGDRLCIYAVQVGNAADGAKLLEQIAALSGCGAFLNAEALDSGQAMNAFVKKVLLTAKSDSDADGVVDEKDRCPDTPRGIDVDMNGCPPDSDKDGVADDKDACPETPPGTKVNAKGCPIPAPSPVATKSAEVTAAGTWLYKDIQFENNKADLRESSLPTLNEITAALKARPKLNIEIQGHTDSSGAREYNLGLSRRRAESVKAFLESRGIDAARMSAKGFGPDRPIDSNATKQGRARNRRVEVKPLPQ